MLSSTQYQIEIYIRKWCVVDFLYLMNVECYIQTRQIRNNWHCRIKLRNKMVLSRFKDLRICLMKLIKKKLLDPSVICSLKRILPLKYNPPRYCFSSTRHFHNMMRRFWGGWVDVRWLKYYGIWGWCVVHCVVYCEW